MRDTLRVCRPISDWERKFHVIFVPGSESSWERKFLLPPSATDSVVCLRNLLAYLFPYLACFNYHRRPMYRINFHLVLNATCPSSTDCMHWSLKQSQIQYQHRKMQDKDYSDEHKHCTIQPFDTEFGGGGHWGQTFELGASHAPP